MIMLTIDSWKLMEMAKKKPDNYLELTKIKSGMPSIEDVVANKCYYTFEAYINDASEIPDFILEIASFKPIKPLKLMIDGSIHTASLKDALATHQVHLPGNELLRIQEVHVEEDCCTDRLQELLKVGWRIIAVCPQPSRRPDYVLGKL